MKPECHHPPFVLNVDGEDINQNELALLFRRALENPGEPVVVHGASAFVNPVECSWCRKPFTIVEPLDGILD